LHEKDVAWANAREHTAAANTNTHLSR